MAKLHVPLDSRKYQFKNIYICIIRRCGRDVNENCCSRSGIGIDTEDGRSIEMLREE